ncbi:unnamed protein product, partial [Scytosiphon promiscuus]
MEMGYGDRGGWITPSGRVHESELYAWGAAAAARRAAEVDLWFERRLSRELDDAVVDYAAVTYAAMARPGMRGSGFGSLGVDGLTAKLAAARLTLSSIWRSSGPLDPRNHNQDHRSVVLSSSAPMVSSHHHQQGFRQIPEPPRGTGFGTLAVRDEMDNSTVADGVLTSLASSRGGQGPGASAVNGSPGARHYPPANVTINSNTLAPPNLGAGGSQVTISPQTVHSAAAAPNAVSAPAAPAPGPSTSGATGPRTVVQPQPARFALGLATRGAARENGGSAARVSRPATTPRHVFNGRGPTSRNNNNNNNNTPSGAKKGGVRLTIRITSEARRRAAAVAASAAAPTRGSVPAPTAARSGSSSFPSGPLQRPTPCRAETDKATGRRVGSLSTGKTSGKKKPPTPPADKKQSETITITTSADGTGPRVVRISSRESQVAVVAASAAAEDPPALGPSPRQAAVVVEAGAAVAADAGAGAARGSTARATVEKASAQAGPVVSDPPVCSEEKHAVSSMPRRVSCSSGSLQESWKGMTEPSAAPHGSNKGAEDGGDVVAPKATVRKQSLCGEGAVPEARAPAGEEFPLPPRLAEEAKGALAGYAALMNASKNGGKWRRLDNGATIPFQLEAAMAQLTLEPFDEEEGLEPTSAEGVKGASAASAGGTAAAAAAAAERERVTALVAETLPKVRAHVEPMEIEVV